MDKVVRSSFVFYQSFYDSIEGLDRNVQADVLIALVRYALRGESDPGLKPVANALFSSFKPQIDKNNQRYLNGVKGGEYGEKGGRPKVENAKETPKKPQNNPKQTPNDNVNDNVLLIDTNVSINNQDALYFFVAKAFHNLFVSIHGKTKTLETSSYRIWVNTARLILEVDKRPLPQLVAIKLYLEAAKAKEQNTDPFWTETISSINTLRKKNKDGHYYYDMIATKVKKWLTVDGNERKVHSVVEKLNKAVNGGK